MTNQNERLPPIEALLDTLVADLTTMTDAEVLAELADEDTPAHAPKQDLLRLFDKAKIESGKVKLAAARSALERARSKDPGPVSFDKDTARARYKELLSGSAGLTLAARKGVDQTERDKESTLDDLAELGAFREEDPES